MRDYGLPPSVWGGDAECGHEWKENRYYTESAAGGSSGEAFSKPGPENAARIKKARWRTEQWCIHCNAWRGCLGLEPTPGLFVAHLVEVMREVKRVLRDDGTLWLNLGDSYANPSGSPKHERSKSSQRQGREFTAVVPPKFGIGLKPKDLVGIPWRVAFALQADGWWLRSEITWCKRAPMPESVTDRPTSATEKMFLLTKSARYYYDNEAVKVDSKYPNDNRKARSKKGQKRMPTGQVAGVRPGSATYAKRNLWNYWIIGPAPFPSVVSYGSYRISSPDCPVHDYQADLERVLQCGEQLAAFPSGYNPDTGDGPAQGQEGVVVSIPLGQFGSLSDGFAAIPHSIQKSKRASESEQGVTFYGILGDRTEYRRFLSRCVAKFDHTRGNKIEQDSASGEQGTDPSEQTSFHIVGIETYLSPPIECTCYYTGKPKKSQNHFAVFPPALVEPCIKAGTSEHGCCPECGAAWVRVVERVRPNDAGRNSDAKRFDNEDRNDNRRRLGQQYQDQLNANPPTTTGWAPGCECGGEPVPCQVLDPFFGAGTVGLVADRLGRDATGIELNPDYIEMARKRIEGDAPMFVKVEVRDAKTERANQAALLAPAEGAVEDAEQRMEGACSDRLLEMG